MTVELLKKIVDASYLDNCFEYGIGKIKKRDEADFEDTRKYHGYRPLPYSDSPYIFKHYQFARVKETNDWRRATDPRSIGRQLSILALTNPVVYLLTTVKRVAEAVLIFAGIFFDTFSDLYPEERTDNLTKAFIISLNTNLRKRKKEYSELWDAVKNDFHCAAVMELAAAHGLLNAKDATRMQFLFSDKERQWNRYKEAEAFKHIEVDETPLYGVSLFFSQSYKTTSPLLWIFMVKEAKKDSSEELIEVILESNETTLSSDLETRNQQVIEWLENNVDCITEARIKNSDTVLLNNLIDDSLKFKTMGIKEITGSSQLKLLFLAKSFLKIAKTNHSGFIQCQYAYPLSTEKKDRVEIMEHTIADSIKESWNKFTPE